MKKRNDEREGSPQRTWSPIADCCGSDGPAPLLRTRSVVLSRSARPSRKENFGTDLTGDSGDLRGTDARRSWFREAGTPTDHAKTLPHTCREHTNARTARNRGAMVPSTASEQHYDRHHHTHAHTTPHRHGRRAAPPSERRPAPPSYLPIVTSVVYVPGPGVSAGGAPLPSAVPTLGVGDDVYVDSGTRPIVVMPTADTDAGNSVTLPRR